MLSSVVKPKYGSQSKGIKSSLYEARGMDAKKNLEVTNDTISKLGKINPLFGVCMTVGNQAQSTSTRLGFTVPHGSPLSYQLSQTEGNFSVSANISAIKGTKCDNVSKVPNFPWNDNDIDEIPQKVLIEAGLHITSEQATDIFNKTTDQSSCELWHEVRKCRLTASKFGAIVRRKKDKGKFIKTQNFTCEKKSF
ncbi:uncharacterized protein LOC132745305 [Ruditapes philippinarum]|uniref:uncharacterized protein LOC132745305 n=1 Tax=Ruditapes philippinarum TaxID=129788 RepID=UPI00295B717D|nr:uncharacterized protein LOC132745305 [Ruditapes philippinarum]